MKDDLYLAKVESLLNNTMQDSEKHMLKLLTWHEEADQKWIDQNLMLKNYKDFDQEKTNRQLQKDKEWMDVLQENQKLELEISRKLENIRELTNMLPSDISDLTRYITQQTQSEEQIRKKVLKKIAQDSTTNYNKIRETEQTSAQF